MPLMRINYYIYAAEDIEKAGSGWERFAFEEQ